LRAVTAHVLGVILRLLQPAMPFVTDTLWSEFGFGEPASLIHAPWPEAYPVAEAAAARAELDWLVRLVSEVRTVRSEMNVPPSVLAPLMLRNATPETLARAERWHEAIGRMARASTVGPLVGEPPRQSAQIGLDEAVIVLPLAGLIDLDVERARLQKDRAKAVAEADKVRAKLSRPDFVERAKPEVVEENRERLRGFEAEIVRIDAALQRIA
jgi:valyl-tRNA synthetase